MAAYCWDFGCARPCGGATTQNASTRTRAGGPAGTHITHAIQCCAAPRYLSELRPAYSLPPFAGAAKSPAFHVAPMHLAAKPNRSDVSWMILAVGLPAPWPARTCSHHVGAAPLDAGTHTSVHSSMRAAPTAVAQPVPATAAVLALWGRKARMLCWHTRTPCRPPGQAGG